MKTTTTTLTALPLVNFKYSSIIKAETNATLRKIGGYCNNGEVFIANGGEVFILSIFYKITFH